MRMDVLLREAEEYASQCSEIVAAESNEHIDSRNSVAELDHVHSRWKA